MAAANAGYFTGSERTATWLVSRGFGADGQRSGGIIEPCVVELPPTACLIRAFHEPASMIGQWWVTPFELAAISTYFARSGAAFAIGRAEGKGVLHATLAVRRDWAGAAADPLSRFVVVRLRETLSCWYGPGDDAPSSGQTSVQKVARIVDRSGRQRAVRQIFLPHAWKYASVFEVLREASTDEELLAVAQPLASPLPFET